MKKFLFYNIFMLLVAGMSFAQTPKEEPQRKIYLLHANTLSFDKSVDTERQVLRGDVRFRQDSVYMYRDSAYFYESKNAMEAFSNVFVRQGDTLSMWCDSLSYYGNTLLLQMFDNVKLKHNATVLTTEYMTYDRGENVAHYPYHGTIVDPDNHLVSQKGWYLTNVKKALFSDDVVLHNYDFSNMEVRPDYPDPDSTSYKPRAVLFSDSLHYDFETADAEMRGPSRIVNDTATVYSTLGIYNTSTAKARLYQRSSIVSPGRFATGDSLHYDGVLGVGDGWGDIVVVDSLQKVTLKGEYMHYIDNPQSVIVTGKALAMKYSDKDTLFLHADTLRAYTIIRPDSVLHTVSDTLKVQEMGPDSIMVDTIKIDTREFYEPIIDTLRYMAAYYGVRYFREDMQGVCDSLHYSVRDAMATCIGNPVMWNTDYQITGDTIFTFMDETKSISRAEIHNAAFLVQEKDTFTMIETGPRKQVKFTLTRAYDQIKGKDLVCYFDSARISQMDMSGNVQIIYYPQESDGAMTGLNQIVGNYLSVWFKEQKMDKLKIWPNPVGSLTPIQLIQPDILTLEGFRWMDYLRPTSPLDVFRKIEMSAEDAAVKTTPLFNQDELNGY